MAILLTLRALRNCSAREMDWTSVLQYWNTHSLGGWEILPLAAGASCGTRAFSVNGIMARTLPLIPPPITATTLSCSCRRRSAATALVGSEASS